MTTIDVLSRHVGLAVLLHSEAQFFAILDVDVDVDFLVFGKLQVGFDRQVVDVVEIGFILYRDDSTVVAPFSLEFRHPVVRSLQITISVLLNHQTTKMKFRGTEPALCVKNLPFCRS